MYRSSLPQPSTRWALLVALALCITMPAALAAQEVLTEVSPKKMTKILTGMGFEVEEAKGTGDNPGLKFELAGYSVVMFLANDNTDAQLYLGFRDKDIKTDKINEWNEKHRFARAYRDQDGDPVLESDIDFTGGVTEANIKAWVKIFRDLTSAYARFLQ